MKNSHSNKTYYAITSALISSLERKSFDDVKVSDICKIVGIHRTTFYSYFSDKYDLLNSCINDMIIDFNNNIFQEKYNSEKEFYSTILIELLNYIYINKLFFKTLLFRNSQSFFDSLKISLNSSIFEMISRNKIYPTIPVDIVSQFYSGAIMSIISWWIKSDCKISKEKLCEYLLELVKIH